MVIFQLPNIEFFEKENTSFSLIHSKSVKFGAEKLGLISIFTTNSLDSRIYNRKRVVRSATNKNTW